MNNSKDWIRSSRFCGLFYGENREDVLENFKKWTPDAIRRSCEEVVSLGYNSVMINQLHFRWTEINLFEQMFELQKSFVEIGHEFDLKVGDHYSSVFMFDGQNKKWRNHDLSNSLSINSDGSLYISDSYRVRLQCVSDPVTIAANQELAREFITNTGADFFMCDDMCLTHTHDVCCCEHCRKLFKKMCGFDLPQIGQDNGFWYNMENPGFRAWLRFRAQKIGRYLKKIHEAIGDDKILFACNSDQIPTLNRVQPADSESLFEMGGYDMCTQEVWSGESKFLAVNWPRVYAEHEVKRAICEKFDTVAICCAYSGTDVEGLYCQNIVTMFNLARRAHEPNDSLNQHYKISNEFEKANQPVYSDAKQFSDVAVVFSRNTRDFYSEETFTRVYDDIYSDEYFGWCEAMLRNGIPYRILLESDLETAIPKEISTLILPNVACMSSKSCKNIEKFVREGGTVIATHETSLFTETGQNRKDFGLSETFGFNYQSTLKGYNIPVIINRVQHSKEELVPRTDGKSQWQRSTHTGLASEAFEIYDAKIRNEVFKEIKTWRLVNTTPQVIVKYFDKDIQTLAHTPIIYRQFSGYPAFVLRELDKGKVLYIGNLPGLMGRTIVHINKSLFGEEPGEYNKGSVPEYLDILRNIVNFARKDNALIKVASDGSVIAKLYKNSNSNEYYLHLAAQTGYTLTEDGLHLVLEGDRTPYDYIPTGSVVIEPAAELGVKSAQLLCFPNNFEVVGINAGMINIPKDKVGHYAVAKLCCK